MSAAIAFAASNWRLLLAAALAVALGLLWLQVRAAKSEAASLRIELDGARADLEAANAARAAANAALEANNKYLALREERLQQDAQAARAELDALGGACETDADSRGWAAGGVPDDVWRMLAGR
jgi:hypothetical protein